MAIGNLKTKGNFMNLISELLSKHLKPSPTFMAENKAREMKAKGFPVISLSTGEPDFDTPEYIRVAAVDAMNKGYTRYTPSGGLKEIKLAIQKKFKHENSLDYSLNEICVSSGAKQIIYNALMASVNPGDEVIIIAPYWVSYPEMVKIPGGIPIIVELDPRDNFKLNINKIEKAITQKTKWLFINSPNNPCGSVYSYDELRNLADMLVKYPDVHVLTDDIYEHLIYDENKFYTLAQVEPKLKSRVLTVNGVSKAYAMTGWRIGYCGGPEELIQAMSTIQTQTTSSPCSVSQMAAAAALSGSQDFIINCNNIYQNRRNSVVDLLNAVPGLSCNSPHGAFYLFVNCSGIFSKKTANGKILINSQDVADYLLEQVYVAVVPGRAFGLEGFFRISFATSEQNLIEACERIHKACTVLN